MSASLDLVHLDLDLGSGMYMVLALILDLCMDAPYTVFSSAR